MANIPPKMKKRQITLGAALDGFEVTPQNPASASADVAAGFLNNITTAQEYIQAVQIAGPFVSVSGINRVRWDLIYLNKNGVVAVAAGAEQIVGVPDFTGAPGNGVAFVATDVFPLAYVKIDESGAVVVDANDLTDIRAFARMGERGVVGELQTDDSTGAGGVIGTLWKHVPVDHRHPPNVGAANPAGIVPLVPAPGVSNVYSRDDHVHALSTGLYNSLLTPNARATTLVFTEYDPNALSYPAGTAGPDHCYVWVLHKFQARARNDLNVWFDVDAGSEEVLQLWPVDNGGTGNNIGLGYSDVTDVTKAAMGASPDPWLYVYAIANPSTLDVALVYSTNAPSVGPNLAHAAFTGYTAWRWVTCINISDQTGGGFSYPALCMRKYDNTVYYIQPATQGDQMLHAAQEPMYGGVSRAGGPYDIKWLVSPMSMLMLAQFWHRVTNIAGIAQSRIRWYGTNLFVAGEMNSIDYINGLSPKESEIITNTANELNADTFLEWIHLNTARQFHLAYLATNDCEYMWWVLGYTEMNDMEIAAMDWSP